MRAGEKESGAAGREANSKPRGECAVGVDCGRAEARSLKKACILGLQSVVGGGAASQSIALFSRYFRHDEPFAEEAAIPDKPTEV